MSNDYAMDTIIKVAEDLCITCGNCIRTCPAGLITKELPVPIENAWNLCIDCGHCVAVCPTGALHQRAIQADCDPIDIHLIPRWEEARQFLVSRRSVRVYVNETVEKDKILQVLDVARFAPWGGNRQADNLRWVVISDSAQVHRVAQMSIDWMKSVGESNPAMYKEAKLEAFTTRGMRVKIRFPEGHPVHPGTGTQGRNARTAQTIALAYA